MACERIMRNNERIPICSSWIRSLSGAFGGRLAILPLPIAISAVVGCSMYPVPDDVTPLKTEEIVRYGRCEMRAAVIDRILEKPGIQEVVTKWLESKKIAPARAARDNAIVELVKEVSKIVEDQQEINRKKYDKLLKCKPPDTVVVERDVFVEGKGPDVRVRCASTQQELKKSVGELKKALNAQLERRLGKANVLRQYLDVAVVYEFEFEITEQNQTKGDAAFRLPLISQTIDADASAALLLTRKGKRTFKTQDKWG